MLSTCFLLNNLLFIYISSYWYESEASLPLSLFHLLFDSLGFFLPIEVYQTSQCIVSNDPLISMFLSNLVLSISLPFLPRGQSFRYSNLGLFLPCELLLLPFFTDDLFHWSSTRGCKSVSRSKKGWSVNELSSVLLLYCVSTVTIKGALIPSRT